MCGDAPCIYGNLPIWASFPHTGRDGGIAEPALSPPQTDPRSSWYWQNTGLGGAETERGWVLAFGKEQ